MRRATALFLFAAATTQVGWTPTPATSTCPQGFRSLEWLVADSPLIVVATIDKLEDAPAGEGEFGKVDRDDPPPTLADLRIESTLKGKPPAGLLRVHSGPLDS